MKKLIVDLLEEDFFFLLCFIGVVATVAGVILLFLAFKAPIFLILGPVSYVVGRIVLKKYKGR